MSSAVASEALLRACRPQRPPPLRCRPRSACATAAPPPAVPDELVVLPAAPAAADAAPPLVAPPPRPYTEWLPPAALAACEPSAAPLRVAVLLSGGVDSALALNAAVAAGHAVTAFYLQIWFQEDFRNSWDACPWETDLAFARATCQQAGVPLRVLPLTAAYWARVVQACVSDVAAGRTPNPDLLCNSRVKFGAFLEALQAEGGGFDRIASGHYAALTRRPLPGGGVAAALRQCADAEKDQTYFLAGLSGAQLASAMFPLARLSKREVRAAAAAGRLPPAARRDSQGLCFLGKVKFSEFLFSHLGACPGALVELESGARLGRHDGFWFHTAGQRQGLRLSGGPWYVAAKDPGRNVVYVSRAYHAPEAAAGRRAFRCAHFSWAGDARPAQGPGTGLRVKVRHGSKSYACELRWEAPGEAAAAEAAAAAAAEARYARVRPRAHDPPPRVAGGAAAAEAAAGLSALVRIDSSDQGLASGQYAVFYDAQGECLGCAVILGGLEEAPPMLPESSQAAVV